MNPSMVLCVPPSDGMLARLFVVREVSLTLCEWFLRGYYEDSGGGGGGEELRCFSSSQQVRYLKVMKVGENVDVI